MSIDSRTLALIRQRLDDAERNIQYVRQALDNVPEHVQDVSAIRDALSDERGARIVEGVFNGQNMEGNDGEAYPVPPNYASKSKLVEGDIMKLSIGDDGSFTYKQINPVDRVREVGKLVVDAHGNFGVKTDSKIFKVLLASVTFYKAREGDEITVLLPKHGEAEWGAVDNVMHQ